MIFMKVLIFIIIALKCSRELYCNSAELLLLLSSKTLLQCSVDFFLNFKFVHNMLFDKLFLLLYQQMLILFNNRFLFFYCCCLTKIIISHNDLILEYKSAIKNNYDFNFYNYYINLYIKYFTFNVLNINFLLMKNHSNYIDQLIIHSFKYLFIVFPNN